MKMRYQVLAILASIAALLSVAAAAPIQEHLDAAVGDIQTKAAEHIVQGNLTKESISQEVNVTKDQLVKQATDHINESINMTSEQVGQKAKEELNSQVNQAVKQPGFEYAFALAGLLGAALILSRRH
jgi:PGF-CTERM protein